MMSIATEPAFGHRLKSLDGVRGVAILSVIAFHTLLIADNPAILPTLWSAVMNSAWAGVDLFFVLSGFLITGNLLDSRGQHGYFRNFYARRTLRIFPLYYAVLIVVFILVPLTVPARRLPPVYSHLVANQIWLWTYLQNFVQSAGPHQLPGFGHFWSLAVEEQFYWVWPFVVFFSSRRVLMKICIAVCVLSPLLRLSLLQCCLTPWAVRELTFTRADTLLFGAMAAILVRQPGAPKMLSRVVKILVPVAILCLAVIMFRHRWLPYEGPDMEIAGYSAIAFLFAVLIYRVVTVHGRLSGYLSNRTLRWFGKYSYAIYVFQAPLSIAFAALTSRYAPGLNVFVNALIVCGCTVVFSCVGALISWNLLESRFLRLKQYFEYRAPAQTPPVSLGQTATV